MSSRRTGWYWVKFNTDPEWRPMYMEKDIRHIGCVDFELWRCSLNSVPTATPDEIGPRINTPDENRPITLDDLRRIAGNLPGIERLVVFSDGVIGFGNSCIGMGIVDARLRDALDILDAKPRRTVLQALKGESE